MQTGHDLTNNAGVPSYRKGEFFKALPAAALADLEPLLAPSSYPSNVVLFTETQPSSGIYVILDGEVKLSINSSDGRRLSFHIAKAGEVLGFSSTLSGGEYEMTADTLYPARIAHISRQVFLQFLARHPEVYPIVTREISRSFNLACEQLRMVGLSTSVPERLARLLLVWSDEPGQKQERVSALPRIDDARRDRRIYRRFARDRHAHAEHLQEPPSGRAARMHAYDSQPHRAGKLRARLDPPRLPATQIFSGEHCR